MCAQDGREDEHDDREGESMIFAPREATPPDDNPVTEEATDKGVELPRTTTGVIRIMRAKGRAEMADLVEELHSAHASVKETTKRAKDLLQLLRTLQRKATGVHATIKSSKHVGDNV
jgi:hypothetical protein